MSITLAHRVLNDLERSNGVRSEFGGKDEQRHEDGIALPDGHLGELQKGKMNVSILTLGKP